MERKRNPRSRKLTVSRCEFAIKLLNCNSYVIVGCKVLLVGKVFGQNLKKETKFVSYITVCSI